MVVTSISNLEIPTVSLLLLGLSIGILSGFTGVGGGFFVTPALIVVGMPVNLAVGTSLFWVFINSLVGYFIHRNHGNSDFKLAGGIVLPALFGVEAGIQITHYLRNMGFQDVMILAVSILLMTFIGAYTMRESLRRINYLDKLGEEHHTVSYQPTALARELQAINIPPIFHFKRSGVSISLWIILLLGFIIGVMTGFIGTGGGVIIVPALVYLMGVPVALAVGNSALPVMLSSLYGSTRYLLSGDVVIPVALVILCASIPGVFYGASLIRHVRGVAIRMVLGITILLVCAGAAFKLVGLLVEKLHPIMHTIANVVTLFGMLFTVALVIIIKYISSRYRTGKPIPLWAKTLLQ
jgi:hypothetical protein